jgi:hypothetical protein
MGMTKQDFEKVMERVDDILESTVIQITGAFLKRITTLEDRLQTAENSLKKAAPAGNTPPINTPPINTAPAGTTSAANTYEF